jgi:diacylglycerol kinase (ATP)
MYRSASLIYNPAAGAYNVESTLPDILARLQEYGWQVDLCRTYHRGDIARLTQAAMQQERQVVLVAGGDGSLNEAANVLAHSQTNLGVLPTGTGNVFARQLGMPIPSPWKLGKLVNAAQALAEGQVQTIDLGRTAGRYFVLWSGTGLDAEISASIEPKRPVIRRAGLVGYAAQVIKAALRYHGAPMTIEVDGETIHTHALLAVATNGPLYGVYFRIAPKAILDDGYLDLIILNGENLFSKIARVFYLLLRRVESDPQAILRRARCIQVTTPTPIPVHVDGEPLTRTPVTIEVVPQSLRILAPRQAPATLFTALTADSSAAGDHRKAN